ncbi:MAG: hypothetical protein JO159_15955 [Acidobacteria bacterium]|nr:hypothetical protein [Acidobacteriota bacterium]MBV9623793.1 hypothetical protein [Acidobacteriota bacterium]
MTRYTVRRTISERATAICLAAAFALSSVPLAAAQQAAPPPSQATAPAQQPEPTNSNAQSNGSSDALPETPGASRAVSDQAPAPGQQKGSGAEQQPVGTAAAGIGNTAGVAASKPAGVAIAPPKQRRVRLLVIKVGAILGAGAAVGTVAALSKASPSRPPGAH